MRWRWLLGLCVLLGVVGTFAVSKLQPPVYRATAVLVVASESAPSPDEGTQLAITYAPLVIQPIVLQRAASVVGHVSARELAGRVHSTAESNSALIDISVDDTNPSRAATRANAVATVFTSVLVEQGLSVRYPVVVFQQAAPPAAPDHPSPTRNAVIGGALALALAIVLIHLLDLWESRPTAAVKSSEAIASEQVNRGEANGVVKEAIDLESAPSVDAATPGADSLSHGDDA
ncbi:MAG: hypothetical protein ACXWQR_05700 [Ktedonobacterales bacterium]